MSDLNARRVALEESFFAEENAKLLKKFKEKQDRESHEKEMSDTFSYIDQEFAHKLYESGLRIESLTALSLLPLVMVAWADGKIASNEADALKKAAAESGLKTDSLTILEQWISNKPTEELFINWQHYVKSLKTTIDQGSFEQLHTKIIEQVKSVASSAGGFVGVGSISSEEKQMIEQIDTTFKS